jgi:hypothetical protein
MKRVKLLSLFFCAVEVCFQFVLFYLIQALFWYRMFREDSLNIRNAAVLLLTALLFYVIRRVSVLVWQFFLGQGLALALLVCLLPPYPFRVLIGVTTVLQCIYSIMARFAQSRENMETPQKVHLGLMIVLYVWAWIIDYTHLMEQSLALSLAGIVLYFVYWRLKSMYEFTERNRELSYFPERYMKLVSRTALGVYTVLMMFFMYLIAQTARIPVFDSLADRTASAFRGLLSRMSAVPEMASQRLYRRRYSRIFRPVTKVGPSSGTTLWDVLLEILYTLPLILIAVFVLWLLLRYLLKVYHRFNGRENDDRREFINPLERREQGPGIRAADRYAAAGGAPSQRIRRIYRKRILSGLSKGQRLKASLTPKEQVREAALSEGARELLSLYEKARYGPEECSKEDVKRMKELAAGRCES